jgi:peptide/nickel transport system substrate-binding protein
MRSMIAMLSTVGWNGRAGVSGRLLMLLLAGMVVPAACAPGGPAASPQDRERVAGPPKVLRLDNRREPYGLSLMVGNNPHQREANYSFHAGLTAYNANSEIVGRLAAKIPSIADGDWVLKPDGAMDVTWKLRPNLTWHDGTPFTAADAAFGYRLQGDPELPTRSTGAVAGVSAVTVVDPLTFIVHWKAPYFDANLSNVNDVSPVPVHLLGDLYQRDKQAFINSPYWHGDFVGLGPYKLVQWEAAAFMEGAAFQDYVLGRPKIDRIIIRIGSDANVSLATFLGGDLDILTQGVTATDRGVLMKRPEFIIQTWPNSTNGAIWQWRDPTAPWVGDESNTLALGVRQAIMHLTDRQTMADTFDPGGPGVAHLFVPPSDPVYKLVEEKGLAKYPYDPTRAAQLLANAGWTKGTDGMLRNSAGQGFPFEIRDGADTGVVFADMLKQGGIDSWLYDIPASVRDSMEQKAKSQGVRVGGGAIAGSFMQQFTSKEVRSEANSWAGLNQGGYVNPDVDRRYEQYLVELDPRKRDESNAVFHKLVADQVLRITWYHTGEASAFIDRLTGPIPLTPIVENRAFNIHEWDLK